MNHCMYFTAQVNRKMVWNVTDGVAQNLFPQPPSTLWACRHLGCCTIKTPWDGASGWLSRLSRTHRICICWQKRVCSHFPLLQLSLCAFLFGAPPPVFQQKIIGAWTCPTAFGSSGPQPPVWFTWMFHWSFAWVCQICSCTTKIWPSSKQKSASSPEHYWVEFSGLCYARLKRWS